MQERFDVVSRLPPEVAVGVLAALDSLEDVMKGAALVCRAWFALATHPALARLWYRRLLRPEPRLPDLSWTVRLPPPSGHAVHARNVTQHARHARHTQRNPTLTHTHHRTRTQENLRTELRACRELGLKRERERIAYSHPTMDRFVWAASRGHIRMIEQLWHKVRTHTHTLRTTHYTLHTPRPRQLHTDSGLCVRVR